MKLNRTPNPLDRIARNGENDNWSVIEGEFRTIGDRVDNIVDEITEEALGEVIDNAKLNWKEPVNSYNELPSVAIKGDTVMDRSTGKVYRHNGSNWVEIQQIDAGPVNEIDTRLTTQLHAKADENIITDLRNGYYEGPVVAFVFDDGRKEMWDLFKDLFESEGVPANVPVVTDWIDTNPNYMTTTQLKELQNLGWCICSHMATHLNVNNITPEEIDLEYRKSSEWLRARGFSSDIIAYPYGATNPIARKIASRYYKMGVNIVRNNLSNDIPDIDNLNLNRLAGFSQPPGAEPTYNEIKQRFDIGVVRNELMIYEDHPQYAIWTPEKIEELRTFIRYIKSQGVPIVNLEDAFNMKCNIIDVGERSEETFYKLHRNGQVSGGGSAFNFVSSDTFGVSDTPDAYPNNKITKFRINKNLTGLPILTSGELIFDKTSPYPNNWIMIFIVPGAVYFRQWINDEWTRWYSSGEMVGDTHRNFLPTANASNWRRMMLVRGHNGHEDKLVVCTRNGDSSYSWKEINLTDHA